MVKKIGASGSGSGSGSGSNKSTTNNSNNDCTTQQQLIASIQHHGPMMLLLIAMIIVQVVQVGVQVLKKGPEAMYLSTITTSEFSDVVKRRMENLTTNNTEDSSTSKSFSAAAAAATATTGGAMSVLLNKMGKYMNSYQHQEQQYHGYPACTNLTDTTAWETFSTNDNTVQQSSIMICCSPWESISPLNDTRSVMDQWWLHRPHWQMAVLESNETHECFRKQYTNDNETEMTEWLKQLHRTQFNPQQNCSNLYYEAIAWGGFGATIDFLARTFAKTHATGDGSVFSITKHWPGAVSTYVGITKGSNVTNITCPRADFSCYFLPIHSCPHSSIPFGHQRVPDNAPKGDAKLILVEKQAFLKAYMTRPHQQWRRKIYDYLHEHLVNLHLLQENKQQKYTAIHVRRTDVALEKRTNRQYFPLKDYIDAANNPLLNVHANSTNARTTQPATHKNTFLLFTDDQTTIDEMSLFSNTTMFVYMNKTRYRGTQGGFAGHIPTNSPADEMVAILAELYIAGTYGHGLVHTKSGYAYLLQQWITMGITSSLPSSQQAQVVVDIAIDQLYKGPRINEQVFMAGLKERLGRNDTQP